MPRLPRREAESGIHHVMNRGVDRQPIFFADIDRIEFGRRLAAIHELFEVTTLAYCLMGNHFHLLLRAPADTLSEAMHHLSSVYARHTNDRLGRDGPLFQGRFHSIPVESDAYLVWVTRYIHRNPLDIPGVDAPEAYRWSSLRSYLGLRASPSFLDPSTVLSRHGHDPTAFARHTGGSRPAAAPRDVDDLRRLIDCALAADDLIHPGADDAEVRTDTAVLLLLRARCCDERVRDLCEEAIGARSASARKSAAYRARKRHGTDPSLARVLAWLERELGVPAASRQLPGT